MAGISVKLNGANRLINKLRFYQTDKKNRVRVVVATVGLLIESEAKRLAPVDTGFLRASIHLELTPNGLGGEVATNIRYAPAQEFGTRFQKPQPFMFPAAEKYRIYFTQAIIAAIRTR